jgi:anti-sigma regulatory factor (Ser/Thr protein kinase)
MTVPGTDTLRGSSAAYARQELWSSAEFAFSPGQDRPGALDWPLCSHLELPARPESARSARLHTRSILRQWDLEALADTVELLVSELVTNAVRAAALTTPRPGETEPASGAPQIRFWLTSDRAGVLIQVWDGDFRHPVCQDEGLEAEAGRGLLLVETLSAQWGCRASDGQAGKVVWALVRG